MRSGQRLVHVGSHLGLEQPVPGVDIRLSLAGVVRMHRMAELVGERAHGVDVVVVAHEDERESARHSGREGAHPLALVGIYVHPTFLERAFEHDCDVFLAEGLHSLRDPFNGLLEWDRQLRRSELRARVVWLQDLKPQCLAPNSPVAMPGSEVVAEGANDVFENGDRDVVGLERSFQRCRISAGAGVEDISLDAGCEVCRHGMPHRQMSVRVALEGGAPEVPVGAREQRPDGALGHLFLAARA